MGFVKGLDDMARTVLNPLEGSVGNISLNHIGASAVSATGNITGSYILGNGSQLSSLTGTNVTGTVANATYAVNANNSTYSGTVTTAAQPNITSVGTLSSVSVTGNVYSNGNIAMVSNLARNTYVANVAPSAGQGAVGDIWYQTF